MLQKGDSVSLFATVVQPQGNLIKVWAQTNSEDSQIIENLMIQSETELVSRKPVKPQDIQVGDVFLARSDEDKRWYRAKILAVNPAAGQVSVFFIDYGNEEVVAIAEIAKGREDQFQLPPQASPFLLADLESRGIQWTEAEIKGLSELLIYGEFLGTVVSVGTVGNPPTLRLQDPHKPGDAGIVAYSIISAGFGKAVRDVNTIALRQTVLEPGQNYHVYVVFYESPLNFWIQLVEREEVINKLQEAIDIEISDTSPTVSPITVGTVCVAKYKDVENNFETFYRSVVTNVLPDGKCQVVFVDYGNHETLSPQELKASPPHILQLPSMAIQCCLHGSVADASDFQRMLECDNIYASVRSVTDSGLHVVDLTEGVPTKVQPQAPPPRSQQQNGYGTVSSPQNPNASDQFVGQFKPLQFNVGKQIDLCISHVENDGKYFCQLLENAPRLNQLMHAVDQVYNSGCSPLTGFKPGMPCISRSVVDKGVFYRSKIIGPSNQPGMVDVQHIDFGVTETVPSSCLYNIEGQLMELPAQAIHCVLAEADRHPPSTVVNALKKYESKTALVGGVTMKTGSLYEMELVDTSGRQDIYVAKNLSASSDSDAPKYTVQAVKSGQWLDVEITHLDDPSRVYCQFSRSQDDLIGLMEQIAAYCDSGKAPRVHQPVLGLPCLAKYSEDDAWYRAFISGVKSSGQTEVHFVDYGNHDNVAQDDLRATNPKFCQLPKQCICVSLDGIVHSAGWSDQETNVLLELLSEGSHPMCIVDAGTECLAQLFASDGTNVNEKFGVGIGKISPTFKKRGPVPNKTNNTYPTSQPKPAMPSAAMAAAEAAASSCTSPTSPQAGWAQWISPASPAATPTIKPIEVGPGYKDVQVEFAVSPNEFYCTLVESADSLGTLMGSINTEYKAAPPPVLTRIVPGAICCTKYGDEWYRAEVIAVSGSNVQVKYIDYGNMEVVNAKDIRELKPKYSTLPRQAIPCTLGSIAPTGDQWSPDAISMFEEFTSSERNLVCAFTAHQIKGCYNVELIETVAGGQRTAHEELKKAKLAVSLESSPVSNAVIRGTRAILGAASNPPAQQVPTDKPVPKFKYQNLTVAQTCDVNVVHVETPNLFWVQQTELSQKLEDLMDSLHNFYSVLPPQQYRPSSVQQGGACVARFTEDEEWYRAEVLSTTRGEVAVRYVDYGNVEMRPISEIWDIDSTFMELPAQAIQCTLHSVAAPATGWSSSAKEVFEDMVSDKNLLAEVVAVTPKNVYSIKLAEVINHKPVLFANKLVQQQIAAFSTPPMSPNRPVTSRPSPRLNSSQDTQSLAPRKPEPSLGAQTYPPQQLRLDEQLDVNLVWLTTPTSFWCQSLQSQGQLESLMASIGDHYERMRMNESSLPNPQPGQCCVAAYEADGNWYRGLVLRTRNREAEVQYVDFGNKEKMRWSKLKTIEPSFLNHPPFAFHCSLKDMEIYENDFNQKVVAYFKQLMQQSLRLTVVSLPTSGGDLYKISLVDSEGRDATEHVAELLGRKVNAKTSLDPPPQPHIASPPRVQRAQAPTVSTPPRSSIPQDVVLKAMNTPLRPGKKSKVIVSNIEDVSHFYCQLSANTGGLDNFMQTLEGYYAAGNGKQPQVSQVKTGMFCVAKFSDDGFWYRASVTQLNPPNKITVLFVDYGNSEDTTLDKMCVLMPKYADYPVQAFECNLKGISGAAEDEVIISFRELVEGKELLASVTGNNGTIVELELVDPDTGININAEMKKKFLKEVSAPKTANKYSSPQVPSGETSVYITHVESPASFWVQLEDKEKEIQEIADSMLEDYDSLSAGEHRLGNAAVGSACMARFSEDLAWYRSIIESTSGDKVTVRFIDYGNTDTVNVSDLKEVMPKYIALSPLALHCRLHGVKPPASGWTPEHSSILENIESAIHTSFNGSASESPVSVKMIVDGQNIAANFGVPVVEEANNNISCFPEARIPQGTVMAYCVHVEGGDVFLQLAEEADTLQSVTDNLEKVYANMANDKRLLTSVAVGTSCCARFSVDNSWYRAVVEVECPSDKVKVRFVDFGNSETVNRTTLKQVAPDLLKLAPMAYKCQIQGLVKPGSGWPEGFQEHLEGLLMDQEIKTTFSGSVTRMEIGGQDVAITVKAQYPILSGSNQPAVNQPKPVPVASVPVASKPERIQNQNCPEVGTEVVISELKSPSEFYVQNMSCLDELVEYMDDLDQACQGLGNLANPQMGQYCCARFSEDGALYRAVVTDVGAKVKVQFVDYGNADLVPLTDLYPLPTGHGQRLAYAGKYQLLGDGTRWNEEQVGKFAELVQDKDLKVLEVVRTTQPPSLKLANEEGEVSLVASSEPQAIILPEQKIPNGDVQCYVSHIEAASKIYIQMSSDSEILEEITNSLQDAYSASKDIRPVTTLEEGTICCGKFTEDESWYRARIETSEGGTIHVRFIDYGNSEDTTPDRLKCLNEPFAEKSALAFCCQITDVNLHESKASEAVAILEETLLDQELTVCFSSSNPPYSVKISVDGKDVSETLKAKLLPEETSKVSETEKITEVEAEPADIDTTTLPTAPSAAESEDEFVETSEEVKIDTAPLTSAATVPLPGDLSSDEEEFADAEEGPTEAIDKPATGDCARSRYGLAKGEKVEIEVTHINSPSQFFCQLVRDDEETNLIAEGLLECEGSGDQITELSKGLICAAKYEDGEWYRGKVIAVDEEQVKAHFLDYGNANMVYKSDLRVLPEALAPIKPQALPCVLHGVVPSNESWSDKAVERFNELVEEKTLLVELMDSGENDVHVVRLLDMGTSLSSILIEENFAKEGVAEYAPVSEELFEESAEAKLASPGKSGDYTYRDLDQAKGTLMFGLDEDENDLEIISLAAAPALTEGQKVEVTLVHSQSFEEMYLQLKTGTTSVATMEEDMQEVYQELSDEPLALSSIKLGQTFAALSSGQTWRRAEVTKVDGNEITVLYVDFGLSERVTVKELQVLKQRYHEIPRQAIECKLDRSGSLDQAMHQQLLEKHLDKCYLARVEGTEAGKPVVTLLDMGTDLITLLSDHTKDLGDVVVEEEESESKPTDELASTKVEEAVPVPSEVDGKYEEDEAEEDHDLEREDSGVNSENVDVSKNEDASRQGEEEPKVVEPAVEDEECDDEVDGHIPEVDICSDSEYAATTDQAASLEESNKMGASEKSPAESRENTEDRSFDSQEPAFETPDESDTEVNTQDIKEESIDPSSQLPKSEESPGDSSDEDSEEEKIHAVKASEVSVPIQGTDDTQYLDKEDDRSLDSQEPAFETPAESDSETQDGDGDKTSENIEEKSTDPSSELPTPEEVKSTHEQSEEEEVPAVDKKEVTVSIQGADASKYSDEDDDSEVIDLDVKPSVSENRTTTPEIEICSDSESTGTTEETASLEETNKMAVPEESEDKSPENMAINTEDRPRDSQEHEVPIQDEDCDKPSDTIEGKDTDPPKSSPEDSTDEESEEEDSKASVSKEDGKDKEGDSEASDSDVEPSVPEEDIAISPKAEAPEQEAREEIASTTADGRRPLEPQDPAEEDDSETGEVEAEEKVVEKCSALEVSNEMVEQESDPKSEPELPMEDGDELGSQVQAGRADFNYKYPSCNLQEILNVYASVATSPGKFSCQLIKSSTTDLPLLSDRIQDFCSSSGPSMERDSITVGMPCIAKCSLDKNWYRGRVTAVSAEKNINVLFVDYGNSEEVSSHDLKPMVPEFLELEVQAFQCQLADIVSNDGKEWDDTSSARFDELVTDKDLQLKVRGEERSEDGSLVKCMVDLWDGPLSIAQALIEGGYAQGKTKPSCDEWEEEEILSSPSELEEPEGQPESLEPETVLDVRFHCGSSPEDFVLHPKEDALKFELLTHALSTREPTACQSPEVGKLVLHNSKRARIIEISGENCTVEYIDVGYTADADTKELLELKEEECLLSPQAIKCRLAGIESESWSEEPVNLLQGLKSCDNLSARVVAVEDGVHNVYLYDTDEQDGSSFNAKLVSKGFAWVIPDSELNMQEETEEALEEHQTELESSFLEANETRRHSFGSLAESESESEHDENGTDDFNKPCLEVGDEKEVKLLCITDPANMTWQLASAEENLRSLSQAMEECGKDGEPPAIQHLFSGRACLASVKGDGGTVSWRRVKVLSKDDVSIVVRHVDYNTIETVSLENLRPINDKCKELPTQAIVCGLSGVKPKDGNHWDPECVALIQRLSEDKTMTLKIVHEESDELLVQLSSSEGKDVADLLLTGSYADRLTTDTNEQTADSDKTHEDSASK